MSLLDVWLTPKVRLKLIVRYRHSEVGYMIQNMVQTWGVPGRIRTMPGVGLEIQLEARQKHLQEKIRVLSQTPLTATCSMETRWLPYKGEYRSLTISF